MSTTRHAPSTCPVCGDELLVVRLACATCQSELHGRFAHCTFCALDEDDRQLLEAFLASRGNMRTVQRHLGVSYPTARARYDEVMGRLRLAEPAPRDTRAVLEALARGEIDIAAAASLIEGDAEPATDVGDQ